MNDKTSMECETGSEMRVKLLSSTPEPLKLLYLCYRQCYYPGSILDFKDDRTRAQKEKFIRSRIKEGHTSVLEHVKFTFAISDVSRTLSHQAVRHRMASWSQQSQRFCEAQKEDGTIDLSFVGAPASIQGDAGAFELFWDTIEEMEHSYSLLREKGISKEDARFLLPNITATNLIGTLNCRSLLNFFELRMDSHAQMEIQLVATKMFDICYRELPCVFEHLKPKER